MGVLILKQVNLIELLKQRDNRVCFKPIVYAAALENGFSPNTIILDALFVESQGVGLKNWKPENYGKKFYGPTTFRKELNIQET